MADDGDTAGEAAADRDLWARANREYADDHADQAWAAEDITWGNFNVPEQQLGVLGHVRGLDAVELGCGTEYFSAWLARRGARPTGVDLTGPSSLPRGAASSGPASSSRSSRPTRATSRCRRAASTWPFQSAGPACSATLPAGFPRPHGCCGQVERLVFHTTSVLAALCCPEPPGLASRELLRPMREARRLVTAQGLVEFHPGYGEWIKLLRASGFTVGRVAVFCESRLQRIQVGSPGARVLRGRRDRGGGSGIGNAGGDAADLAARRRQ